MFTDDYRCAFKLAKLIINSVEARESSFDNKAADEATVEKERIQQEAKAKGQAASIFLDYDKFYRLSLHDACKQECSKEFVDLVHVILLSCSNNALGWANKIVKESITHG